MNAFKVIGMLLFAALYGLVYIPLALAYYAFGAVLAVFTFTFCAMLVMVYKFAAWLSRLSR